MNRETLEQLVSEWLDRPERDDLRAAVEAAVAESPALESVKDEWLRLDRLVRGASPGVAGVDWSRLREHIGAALERANDGASVDGRLRDVTEVGQRVDWPRLRARISRAVADADAGRNVIRCRARRAVAGLALVSAAAAVVIMFALPGQPPAAPSGSAELRVNPPVSAQEPLESGRGFAQVTVSARPDVAEGEYRRESPPASAGDPQLVEVFLMVGPARLPGDTRGRLSPFGFN
jgi:hypothetical protein